MINNNIGFGFKMIILFLSTFIVASTKSFAKQYKIENGTVSCALPAPVGQLLALNPNISGSLDSESGSVLFNVGVAGFQFVTAGMPDHINAATTKRFKEYYLETEKYPEASFKGSIIDLKKVDFSKNGTYEVLVKGFMTMHGVTKEIAKTAHIKVDAGKILFHATVEVAMADYKVRTPESLGLNFFRAADIEVNCPLRP